jgi:predicted nucleic acid-binding protein
MNPSVFLDTPVFFQCVEKPQFVTILEHAINAGYSIQTSITVLGEAVTQMYEKTDSGRYLVCLNQLIHDWDTTFLFPKDRVRVLCYVLGDDETDTRMIREPTDRTHLAYAMAYESEYFLTSDKNLIKYRIPPVLEKAGFFKPKTMPLEKFRDNFLKKK